MCAALGSIANWMWRSVTVGLQPTCCEKGNGEGVRVWCFWHTGGVTNQPGANRFCQNWHKVKLTCFFIDFSGRELPVLL
jgi:hypothetical protein